MESGEYEEEQREADPSWKARDEQPTSFIVRINEKIREAYELTPPSKQHSIFKVPNRLRQQEDKVNIYDPEVISIGPYHHQLAKENEDLVAMETHKRRYLFMLLQRKNQTSVKRYIRKLETLEQEARGFYADPTDHMNEDEFMEMMLLDGFFIVELLRKCKFPELQDGDICLLSSLVQDSLVRDLLLLENQLPFFVLQELFDMTMLQEYHEHQNQIIPMAIDFLSNNVMGGFKGNYNLMGFHNQGDIKHLLDLLHRCWRPPIRPMDPNNNAEKQLFCERILSLPHNCCRPPSKKLVKDDQQINLELMPCATKLQAAGIKFKKLVGMSLFDLKFEDGVLWIPSLKADLDTEKILRNLVAYEQCRYKYIDSKHATDYVVFMDFLIDTGKDVESLVNSGVILNLYSNDEDVATMFNKLGNNVLLSSDDFLYSDIFNKVQKHYNRIMNKWMATLRQNYFNTPWSIFSVFAAFVVIVFTITQTAYTVIPYYHPH